MKIVPSTLLLVSTVSALLLGSAGCLESDDKGLEEEVPTDGKLDSFRSPIWHGAIPSGGSATAEITNDEHFHAWEFWVTDSSRVNFTTKKAVGGNKKVDTVLYLYREKDDGSSWGSYIGRNDDFGGTVWSSLTKNLEYGHYRVLVKGYDTGTRGKFELVQDCTDGSCGPNTAECGLGSTYREYRDQAGLTTIASARITSTTGLSALEKEQIVLAVHQSAHDDVTTAEEALSRVDQNEIFKIEKRSPEDRAYTSYEYGAGDNSYGAIFFSGSTELAASIHDGDLYDCVVAGN